MWRRFFAVVIGLTVVTMLFTIAAVGGALTSDYWLLVYLAIVLGWAVAVLGGVALLLAGAVTRRAKRG